MTVSDKLKEVSAFLASKGIEFASKEAEIFITEALQIERSKLYTTDLEISDEISDRINSLAERRAAGEPLQYIIGHVDFYGLKIKVGPGVLIPRPETELLVEEVIKAVNCQKSGYRIQDAGYTIKNKGNKHHASCIMHQFTHPSSFTFLDLCTGSGCIALALAKNIPGSVAYAVDVSEKALGYAEENAKTNGISNITFLKGSLFEPVKDIKFDIIVSNPPYIKSADIEALQPEIRDWEPVEALNGGEDGLEFYRRIIPQSLLYLRENGRLFVEIGEGEAPDVARIASSCGFKHISIIKDYSGIERIMHIKKQLQVTSESK